MSLASSGQFGKTLIVKNPHVTQIWVDQELIIMEETRRTYFSLNPIGAKMWSLFNVGAMCLIDLAQYLQKEYRLEEERSILDAQQFVELLLANDLVYLNEGDSEYNHL